MGDNRYVYRDAARWCGSIFDTASIVIQGWLSFLADPEFCRSGSKTRDVAYGAGHHWHVGRTGKCPREYRLRIGNRWRHFMAWLRIPANAVSNWAFWRGDRDGFDPGTLASCERRQHQRVSRHALVVDQLGISHDASIRLRPDHT